MKKIFYPIVFAVIVSLVFCLTSCGKRFESQTESGNLGSDEGVDFMTPEEISNKFAIGSFTLKMDVEGDNELFYTVIQAENGYFYATYESPATRPEEGVLLIKEGSVYNYYSVSDGKRTFISEYENGDVAQNYIGNLFMLYFSSYSELDSESFRNNGKAIIAERNCTRYLFSYSGYGAAVEYEYYIDDQTGICMKFVGAMQSGGEGGSYSWEVVQITLGSASLSDYSSLPLEEEITYFHITFNSNGGGAVSEQTIAEGTAITKPTAPNKLSSYFIGWYFDAGLKRPIDFENYVVYQDITLYAEWATIYTEKDIDFVDFGLYPQAQATKSVSAELANGAGNYLGNNVTEYEGKLYLEWLGNEERYYNNGYDDGKTYYFELQPIKWRVLESSESELFLLSEKILSCQNFNEVDHTHVWNNSLLQNWMNGEFFDMAFNNLQNSFIAQTVLDNQGTGLYEIEQPQTADRVFPLSYADMNNSAYGFSLSTPLAACAKATDYCKATGIKCELDGEPIYWHNAAWFLRSPGNNAYSDGNVLAVFYDGNIKAATITCGVVGARPAMRLVF